jgi:hypothetical protein
MHAIAQGEKQIASLNAILAERDQEISMLRVRTDERDRRIAAMKSRSDRLGEDVMARNENIRALRNSTSWKVTAPIRWGGRKLRGSGIARSRIIRFERIEQEPLAAVPYQWAVVDGLFSTRAAQALVRTYPRDNFKTVKGYDNEKGCEYEARALIRMNATSPSFPERLSDAWRKLADDLLSPSYRVAMTRLTGHELSAAPMEAYVCHYGPGAWLGPHLDLKEKIVTHVLYFNKRWKREDGGCLNILQSGDGSDKFAEIAPTVGNSSVLIRSENSWHSVSRVADGCPSSRRSMNVIFYRPGALSTMWPPGDDAPLHWYEPPHEAAS